MYEIYLLSLIYGKGISFDYSALSNYIFLIYRKGRFIFPLVGLSQEHFKCSSFLLLSSLGDSYIYVLYPCAHSCLGQSALQSIMTFLMPQSSFSLHGVLIEPPSILVIVFTSFNKSIHKKIFVAFFLPSCNSFFINYFLPCLASWLLWHPQITYKDVFLFYLSPYTTKHVDLIPLIWYFCVMVN